MVRVVLVGMASFALSGCMVVSWRSRVIPPEALAPPVARTSAAPARLDVPCMNGTALKVSMLITLPVVNKRVGQCRS